MFCLQGDFLDLLQTNEFQFPTRTCLRCENNSLAGYRVGRRKPGGWGQSNVNPSSTLLPTMTYRTFARLGALPQRARKGMRSLWKKKKERLMERLGTSTMRCGNG